MKEFALPFLYFLVDLFSSCEESHRRSGGVTGRGSISIYLCVCVSGCILVCFPWGGRWPCFATTTRDVLTHENLKHCEWKRSRRILHVVLLRNKKRLPHITSWSNTWALLCKLYGMGVVPSIYCSTMHICRLVVGVWAEPL